MPLRMDDSGDAATRPTGAVVDENEDSPIEMTQDADNSSTNAVDEEEAFSHYLGEQTNRDVTDGEPTGAVDDNDEPVTSTVSWLDDAETKVVTPKAKSSASSKTQAETKG